MHPDTTSYCSTPKRRASAGSPSRQGGFSLYELIAAIAVLGVISGIIITHFSGANSKGQATYSLLQSLGQAAERFNLDTGCYPTQVNALFVKTAANGSGNTCGTTLTSTWSGPYMTTKPTTSNGAIQMHNLGSGVTVQFENGSTFVSGLGGTGPQHAVVAKNLPAPVAQKAAESCGLTSSGSGYGTTTSSQAACTESTPSGGTASVTFVYSQGG